MKGQSVERERPIAASAHQEHAAVVHVGALAWVVSRGPQIEEGVTWRHPRVSLERGNAVVVVSRQIHDNGIGGGAAADGKPVLVHLVAALLGEGVEAEEVFAEECGDGRDVVVSRSTLR